MSPCARSRSTIWSILLGATKHLQSIMLIASLAFRRIPATKSRREHRSLDSLYKAWCYLPSFIPYWPSPQYPLSSC